MTLGNRMHGNKSLKLVYLIPSIHNSGGMERVLCNKANWLVKHGYQIHIVTTDQKHKPPFFDFSSEVKYHDLEINYEDIQLLGTLRKIKTYFRKRKLHRTRLEELLNQLKADIVISMFGTEMRFFWKYHDGSRKIAEIHFSKDFRMHNYRKGFWWWVDWWRSKRDKRYIRQLDKFVVLTHNDKACWGQQSNIEVIHNACPFVSPQQALLTQKRAIAVGRFVPQKGFDTLIEAWNLVTIKHPDWRLTIIGDGEDRDILQQQISRFGLTNKIDLKAPTSRIQEEYISSSIYVLSSRLEGFGMVLVEAMSCGLPAVSFACSGPQDIIRHGETGLLIPQGDIEALALGICRLIEDKDLRLRMGKLAAQDIQERFSIEHIMHQWENLFEDICKNHKLELL